MSLDTPNGYHGYWADDLYAINSKYGTAEDLKSLVSSAHQKVTIPCPLAGPILTCTGNLCYG